MQIWTWWVSRAQEHCGTSEIPKGNWRRNSDTHWSNENEDERERARRESYFEELFLL